MSEEAPRLAEGILSVIGKALLDLEGSGYQLKEGSALPKEDL